MSDRDIMNAKNYKNAIHAPVRPKPMDFARWLVQSLDIEAEEQYGEFGYDTLSEHEKLNVIAEIYSKGYFDGL